MSVSINRNVPPRHREKKDSGGGGGGSTSYVQRTVEVTIDSLTDAGGATLAVGAGEVGALSFFISMEKLAYQLGMTLTDSDFMDSTHNVKPCPLLITSINVGRIGGTGNRSLKTVGIAHDLRWSTLYGGYVALWVQIYELNSTSAAVTPSLPELRNTSFEIQVLQEAPSWNVTPVVSCNFTTLKKNAS